MTALRSVYQKYCFQRVQIYPATSGLRRQIINYHSADNKLYLKPKITRIFQMIAWILAF